PDNGCWGGAGYVAYSYLGGPYLLVPYPACRYGNGLGFGRVFIHEMSHTFWALDEYASAAQSCSFRSGYLDVSNRNTLYLSCQETVPCIMQSSSPPFTEPQPICEYTEGQVGISGVEIDATTYLRVFAVPPTVELLGMPGVLDTLLPGEEYFLSMEITNIAVPNRNPQQNPPDRVNYAPYIKGGWLSINKQGWRLESPADGKWGHSPDEAITKEISGELVPGLNTIDFRAENRIGLSGTASKNLFLIGLRYNSVYAIPGDRCIPYSYVDTAVVATHKYSYRLEGTFSITFRGEKHDYAFSSKDVSTTASVPVGTGIVSNMLPNPTRDHVLFTVNVPKSFSNASSSRVAAQGGGAPSSADALGEVRTLVDISVYNVLGQRIKVVYSNSVYSGMMTLEWDGTDAGNGTVPAGVYFLRVIAGNETAVRKVVILR
ncbi:MAG: T9SS type A sorting domain-containing protein, partial [Candidatus Krumholzibacteria bacterium]|nr:T9SS type A sorting domain-containing protein [Candidatus Krumholzibacteria bacterium]